MKVTALTTLSAVLVLLMISVACDAQGGFFSTLRNFFRPRRQARPPPSFRRPPPPQPQGNFQPSFNQFEQQQQQNHHHPQHHHQHQQPAAFNTVSDFNADASNNKGKGHRDCPPTSGGVKLPRTLPSKNNYKKCAEEEPAPFCPQAEPNHYFEGKRYLITWLIDECPGCLCKNFTGQQADEYCKSMGARAVSIDTPSKKAEMERLSARYGQRYYWTGGRMDYPRHSYTWPSGVTTCIEGNDDPWSTTGGWDEKPQPDNRNQLRDSCEPELCIGVLNNFYADGIVWHDVACHHKKPTICEWL